MTTRRKGGGRAKPAVTKAGAAGSPKRRYCGGGKLYGKGGRLRKGC